LKKLKLKAAAIATPEMNNAIAYPIKKYKENAGSPKLAMYSLALLFENIMKELQEDKAVIDDYIKDRFDLTPEQIRKEIQTKLND